MRALRWSTSVLLSVALVAWFAWTVFVGRDALLNGYWDRHLYERGALHRSLPFDVLRDRSRIDDRAREAGDSPEFSQRIRAGLPQPPPWQEAGDETHRSG